MGALVTTDDLPNTISTFEADQAHTLSRTVLSASGAVAVQWRFFATRTANQHLAKLRFVSSLVTSRSDGTKSQLSKGHSNEELPWSRERLGQGACGIVGPPSSHHGLF